MDNERGGPLQPQGHTLSGSSIGSGYSGDSGLISGQSSSTDMQARQSSTQLAQSSGFQSPTSDISSDEEIEEVRRQPILPLVIANFEGVYPQSSYTCIYMYLISFTDNTCTIHLRCVY